MKKDLFAALSDRNYLEQAKQLFYGAKTKGAWKGDMMLLAYQVPEEDLHWFRSRGILIYDCPAQPDGTMAAGKWPPVVLAKFQILTSYFKKWKNVVLMDVDIIIRSSIEALADVEGFNAVQTHDRLAKEFLGMTSVFLRGLNSDLLKDLHRDFDMNRPAFSTGVIAFSTDCIEGSEGAGEKTMNDLMALHLKYGIISAGGEEPAFNLLFRDWKHLPIAYNVFPDELLDMTHLKPGEIPGIVLHFILRKPWDPSHPFYGEWKASYDAACSDESWAEIASPATPPDVRLVQDAIDSAIKKAWLKRHIHGLRREINDWIGLCGLAIQRLSPRSYAFLKKRK